MATGFAFNVSASSYFTHLNPSGFIPDPYRLPQREIARRELMALMGYTRTLPGSSALLRGSTPIRRNFNPSLGPVGFGRPKPGTARRDARERARYPMNYSWGDMTNLRPDDRGMDAATCREFYRMSIASGEQEPPITTAADASDWAAPAAQSPRPVAATAAETPAKKQHKSAKSARRAERKKEKAERKQEKDERKKEKREGKERRETRE